MNYTTRTKSQLPRTPMGRKRRSSDWPPLDVDEGLPFLLSSERERDADTPRRGSMKAQQVLGLVTVTGLRARASSRNGVRHGVGVSGQETWRAMTALHARKDSIANSNTTNVNSEEHGRRGYSRLDISEEDDDDVEGGEDASTISSTEEEEPELRSSRRHSLKAQQMLGLVRPNRPMDRATQSSSTQRHSREQYRTSFLSRTSGEREEERPLTTRTQSLSLTLSSDADTEDERLLASIISSYDTADEDLLEEGREDVLQGPESYVVALGDWNGSVTSGPHTPVGPVGPMEEWDRVLSQTSSPRTFRGTGFVNFSRPLSQKSPWVGEGSFRGQQSPQWTAGSSRDAQSPQTATQDFGNQHSPQASAVSAVKVRERASTPQNSKVARDDIGLPRTPSRAHTLALAKPIFERITDDHHKAAADKHPYQRHRRSNLWTSLPMCLVRIGKRRGSENELSGSEKKTRERMKKDLMHRLTEDNLRQYEVEVGSVHRPLNRQLLPTPTHSPFQVRDPLFLNSSQSIGVVDAKPLPTPPLSASSAYTENAPPTPSKDMPFGSTSRITAGTPTPQSTKSRKTKAQAVMSTCEVCKESKPSSPFPLRPCTSKCTHPPRTCADCVRQWVTTSILGKGWDSCFCPECKECLGYEDVRFFAAADVFARCAPKVNPSAAVVGEQTS